MSVTHPALSPSQRAFLNFHIRHVPVQWKWHMQGMHLRATSERGRSVTLDAGGVSELLQAGLLMESHGASVTVTDLGKAATTAHLEKAT